jgi:hypothetical protein
LWLRKAGESYSARQATTSLLWHLHEGRGAAYVTWNTDSASHISTLDDRNSLAVRGATAAKETLMVNAAMQDGQGSGMIVDVVL